MFIIKSSLTIIPVLFSFQLVVTGKDLQSNTSTETVGIQRDNSDLLGWITPEKIRNEYPAYLSGYDYNNLPVLVLLWGKWDTQSLVEEGGQDLKDFLRRTEQFIERVKTSYYRRPANESEMGSGEDEVVLLIDYDGFDLRQVQSQKRKNNPIEFTFSDMRLAMTFFEQLESCYEKFAYGYIVNANTLVDGILNLGKGIMGRFLGRVEIHGANPKKYIPQILKKIPRSQLSAEYGGYEDFKPLAFYG